MTTPVPPKVFSDNRRTAARRRSRSLQRRPDAARYILDDMVEDVLERLAFLRVNPRRALIIGASAFGAILVGTAAWLLTPPDEGLFEQPVALGDTLHPSDRDAQQSGYRWRRPGGRTAV